MMLKFTSSIAKVIVTGGFFLFYLINSHSILAQQQLDQEGFIKGCATYRASMIHDLVDVMVDFSQLVDSLKAASEYPDAHELFRERFMKGILSEPFYSVRGLITDVYPYAQMHERSSFKTYREWGHKNRFALHEVNVLSSNFIIEQKQPFKLTNLKSFWEEILFYDIRSGHTIFDVGTGNGFLSFIIAMTGLPLDIYMTEIEADYFSYLTDHIELYKNSEKPARIEFVKGEEKVLGIQSIKADRIILRDSYHHFEYPDEMLASIREQLKEDGFLVLMEATTDLKHNKKTLCKKAISDELILKSISKNGFELVERKIVEVSHLMKFKKSP